VTDEELAAIKARLEPMLERRPLGQMEAIQAVRRDMPKLIAELERLRRRDGRWVLTHEGHERVTDP
jgi:hypothetical protein